ncbi:hypothetical protein PC116_g7338 [Phytophthora cactorum]|uniref:Uncharacterized protein n=1 Tax=Phytophthora cactorum TaxID=29920 RepID=A0A8T1LB57_9STRA|nr:hypothetical protein PC114_g13497 [Phytophthora cactorum]KAG2932395.1 hypothetical protein PC117_g13156 [Phytophthora cactorum]KAG3159138.1 hypothetical protein C6341_g14181 [Phytophthora cactorum]KAG4244856.1 hypothetical protein PC116_g7338 [Phytophthora cactorum]
MTTTVAQEPTRPPTSSPRRLATAEERQRVLTAYKRGDDWLTVARCNNMSRAPAYRQCKTGDPSPPARGGARASVVKST